ncbi:DUF3387 domain-containing protein [Micromonospora sp. WMMD956]|uniref:type I restriction enzyme endonuclease domain-containing protein n=1 Tax=Micromonospora sp. WMMD956 TaxID=3016108 RepID=UPI002416B16E|nr:type I restriction enzyme endonuclease domain-containing protein [Micromonospora sp. WMMD956]MDG4817525.1 DUF3387 domain-containing protein [Micromonospora sp. WMMD956]
MPLTGCVCGGQLDPCSHGVGTLAEITRQLVKSIQSSITADWFSREPVRAKLRSHIRRLLSRYDYPPDHERSAVDLVVRQMETFANEWSSRPERLRNS